MGRVCPHQPQESAWIPAQAGGPSAPSSRDTGIPKTPGLPVLQGHQISQNPSPPAASRSWELWRGCAASWDVGARGAAPPRCTAGPGAGRSPPVPLPLCPLTCTAHVSRGEAAEGVAPAGVRVVGHGIDDGLQVLLLLQTRGVGLRRACGDTPVSPGYPQVSPPGARRPSSVTSRSQGTPKHHHPEPETPKCHRLGPGDPQVSLPQARETPERHHSEPGDTSVSPPRAKGHLSVTAQSWGDP